MESPATAPNPATMQTPPPATAPATVPATVPAPTPKAADTGDKFDAFISALTDAQDSGAAATVEVSRVSAAGRQPVARMEIHEFDPYKLGSAYGPGRYFCRLRIGTTWRGSCTIDQTQTPPASAGAVVAPNATAPAPGFSGEFNPNQLLTVMMQMQQQSMQSMTAILTALITRDTGPKLGELAALLQTGKRSDIGELVTAMKQLNDMAPAGEGREGGDDLTTILGAIAPAIAKAATSPPPAPRPRPRPQPRPMIPLAVPPLARPANAPAIPPAVAERFDRAVERAQHQARKPTAPAAAPDDISTACCRLIRGCYSAGLSPIACAAAMIAQVDTMPDGADALDLAAGMEEAALTAHLGDYAPEFKTGERSGYAAEVAAALLSQLNAEEEEEEDEDAEISVELDPADEPGQQPSEPAKVPPGTPNPYNL